MNYQTIVIRSFLDSKVTAVQFLATHIEFEKSLREQYKKLKTIGEKMDFIIENCSEMPFGLSWADIGLIRQYLDGKIKYHQLRSSKNRFRYYISFEHYKIDFINLIFKEMQSLNLNPTLFGVITDYAGAYSNLEMLTETMCRDEAKQIKKELLKNWKTYSSKYNNLFVVMDKNETAYHCFLLFNSLPI